MKQKNPARTRRARLAARAVLFVVLALFLPGPNGVVRVLGRQFRAARLTRENRRLEREIDSLQVRARKLTDPDSATQLARELLGPIVRDSANDSTP
jgi:cell division protein FtsB